MSEEIPAQSTLDDTLSPDQKETLMRVKDLKHNINSMVTELEMEFDIHNANTSFAKIIQEKNPDYQKYRLYHELIDSSPPDYVTEFDFSGDDSVYDWLERQEIELKEIVNNK